MGKVLEVKKLKISFRTPGGTLKAVRDISFDLERGETLAFVGESGSGKSVTSKAVLGILAGNSIVEGGEILYDGKDLLKISEDDMYRLRGDKIAMIFQDPLSSLNPIVRIGKQITEAMLLKNKVNRREAKTNFNTRLAFLRDQMILANPDKADDIRRMCKEFDGFNIAAIRLENHYNEALSAVNDLASAIDDFTFRTEKKIKLDRKQAFKGFASALKKVKDPYLTRLYDAKIAASVAELGKAPASFPKDNAEPLPEAALTLVKDIRKMLTEIQEQPRPNFFRIGYYTMRHPEDNLSALPVEEANEKALKYLDENFMSIFLPLVQSGIRQSYVATLENKKAVVAALKEQKPYFAAGEFDKADAAKRIKALTDLIDSSIDRMEINKDSIAYTFGSTASHFLKKYFYYQKRNPREEARFAKQSAKREALIAKGKNVDWKVVPKTVYDLNDFSGGIVEAIEGLEAHYVALIDGAAQIDFSAKTIELIDYFKDRASQVVFRLTKGMAKEKALKLMEEVGIPEPRIRYYQYPFEFSGGMRQRIVIAIALSANPDILICDEPTTALDVTIQAQILELINKLKRERGLSVIFITHDLGVVANMADKIAVMYAGKIVETGTADDIFYDPRHPYTWALLSSMPDLDTNEKLDAIPGTPPNMIYPPEGDAFAARNKYAMQIDFEQMPPCFKISETHSASTWLLHPNAPKIEIPKIITDRIRRMKAKEEEGETHGEQ